jgi:hypothetical protein
VRFTWCWTKDRPDGENMHPGAEETEVVVEFLARGAATELVLTHTGFHNEKLRKGSRRRLERLPRHPGGRFIAELTPRFFPPRYVPEPDWGQLRTQSGPTTSRSSLKKSAPTSSAKQNSL